MRARARLRVRGFPPLKVKARSSWRGHHWRARAADLTEGKLRAFVPAKGAAALALAAFDWGRIARAVAVTAVAGSLAALFIGVGFSPALTDAVRRRIRRGRP